MGRSDPIGKGMARRERAGLLSFHEVASIPVSPKRKLEVLKHGDETSRPRLNLVFNKDCEIAEFVISLLPQKMGVEEFGPFTTIGISEGDKLIAGAVYHRWRQFDCELTFAASSPKWCRKGVLKALFHYPFVQQGLERMTLIIGENNPRAIKLNTGLGFRIEGRARKAYDGKHDAFVLGMLKDECKWIKEIKVG